MDLFVEKEFIEEFELEYFCSDHKTESQNILYRLFTEYTYIRFFTNANEKFIEQSEFVSRLTDNNARVTFEFGIDKYFQNFTDSIFQTLIFTREPKKWFQPLVNKGALCFSLSDFESGIMEFIQKTHRKFDLSDPDNLPFKWNKFRMIYENSNVVIFSDPYILTDKSQQELKHNLIPLLKENLDKNHDYLAFIFTITTDGKIIEEKIKKIYSELANYNIKFFVFNTLKFISHFDLHDRFIYSNYTISKSGLGFNLNSVIKSNSEISSSSIFEKYTYKKFCTHLLELSRYTYNLENLVHLNNPYKSNSPKAFKAFRELINCLNIQ